MIRPTEYLVMRLPCLPEDEGRSDYRGKFSSREEAQNYIDDQDDNGKGYFKKGDFKIVPLSFD